MPDDRYRHAVGSALASRLALALSLAIGILSSPSLEARKLGLATPWEVWCCDSPDCFPAHHYYADQLHHAGRWLDVTGFDNVEILAPADLDSESRQICTPPSGSDPQSTGRAVAFVHDNLLDRAGERFYVCSAAIEAGYLPTFSSLFLRSTTYLSTQGLDWDDPDDRAQARHLYAPTHELFHGVQNAYHPKFDKPEGWSQERKWIWEGTAIAVQIAYSDQFMPGIGPRPDARLPRQYDVPLHEPVDDPDPCSPGARTDSYGTAQFWMKVGRRLGSQHGIAYIANILEQNLDDERGLAGVDAALAQLNQPHGGLYHLLPWFFSTLDTNRNYFGHPEFLSARLPAGRSRDTLKFPGHVRKVAGFSHNLEVSHSSDKPVEVEIRFKEDQEYLHLIVDGNLYSSATLGPRNLYRDLLVHGNRKEYDIVVANVARQAVDSEDRDYELEVELREVDYCTMTAHTSGDVGGSYFGDVAHFSTTGGATIYGAFSNPEMIAGVAEWLGGMAEMAGGEGAGEQIEQMKEEMQAGASEIPRETFGLSLSEQKLDADAEQSIAVLAGGFTLEASVIGPEVGEGVTGSIPLTMLRVVPGPRAESTLDKVPFVWVQGAPGSAQLFITRNTGDLVAGRISGTLYAEGYYKPDGSAPVITVNASFVALPGPTGCLGVAAPF